MGGIGPKNMPIDIQLLTQVVLSFTLVFITIHRSCDAGDGDDNDEKADEESEEEDDGTTGGGVIIDWGDCSPDYSRRH